MRPPAPAFPLSNSRATPFTQLLGALGVVAATFGCAPPTPAQKASEAARELNLGARWGKMQDAVQRASKGNRATFMKNRAQWHNKVRILDSELASLNMDDATHATVLVDVSWNFADDPTLRVTRLSQKWSDSTGKWVMLSEKRTSGDEGLFGEEVKKAEKTRDKHFPSRTIHSSLD